MPEPGFPYRYVADLLQHPKTLAAVYSNALALLAPAKLAGILPSISLPDTLWGKAARPTGRLAQGALVLSGIALFEELKRVDSPTEKTKAVLQKIRSKQLDHLPKRYANLPDIPLPAEERLIIDRYSKKDIQSDASDAEQAVKAALTGCSEQSESKTEQDPGSANDLEQGWRSARAIAPIGEDSAANACGLAELLWHLVALKDWTTAAHSVRVADLCMTIANRRSVPEADLHTLLLAGLLHDVGKLGVDSALLEKEGDLEPPERSKMRSHARMGEELLTVFPTLRDASIIVGRHHEKCDGTGYPLGLSGTEIDHLSRILTVADVYDALAYERPYRAALDQADVFAIMRHDMEASLDQGIVTDLHAVLAEESLAS